MGYLFLKDERTLVVIFHICLLFFLHNIFIVFLFFNLVSSRLVDRSFMLHRKVLGKYSLSMFFPVFIAIDFNRYFEIGYIFIGQTLLVNRMHFIGLPAGIIGFHQVGFGFLLLQGATFLI